MESNDKLQNFVRFKTIGYLLDLMKQMDILWDYDGIKYSVLFGTYFGAIYDRIRYHASHKSFTPYVFSSQLCKNQN